MSINSKNIQSILEDWIRGFARVLGKEPDANFQVWMYEHFSSAQDERVKKYWRLLAKLKNIPFSSERSAAFKWLLKGLERRVR